MTVKATTTLLLWLHDWFGPQGTMARVLNGNMAANHLLLIPDVSGGSQCQKGDTCQGGAQVDPGVTRPTEMT